MSINPNWMRGPKEKSSHLEDNENHVCDTAYGVTLVRKPNGDLFFIDKKGNRVPNENVPGHFETIEHEERDPDRLHVYYCFIFDSGEIFVYGEDTYSYSGHSFCEHNAFYPSRRELFDSL